MCKYFPITDLCASIRKFSRLWNDNSIYDAATGKLFFGQRGQAKENRVSPKFLSHITLNYFPGFGTEQTYFLFRMERTKSYLGGGEGGGGMFSCLPMHRLADPSSDGSVDPKDDI